MNALSSAELKVDDLGDELRFTISRETGLFEILIVAGGLSGLAVYAFLEGSVLIALFCMVPLGAMVINWAQGPTTVFRISANRIVATGNLHRWSASDFSIAASEVKSIGWSHGGERRHQGIYVWHGWGSLQSTCVLPGLSHKKAQDVIDAIIARYPQFKIESGATVSLSFGAEI
jgi:hypothetical protein